MMVDTNDLLEWMKGLNLPGGTDPNVNQRMNFGDWASAGGDIMQGIAGLGQTAIGYQQYKLGKKAFNESKRQFDLNFGAQQKTTNAALADRQRARLAFAGPTGGGYQPLDEYMRQYGI